jgi:hypothetical protein
MNNSMMTTGAGNVPVLHRTIVVHLLRSPEGTTMRVRMPNLLQASAATALS